MSNLSMLLSELDWNTNNEQEAVLQIMHFYGCFTDDLPTDLLSSEQIDELKAQEASMEELSSMMQAHLKRPVGVERAMLASDDRLKHNKILCASLMHRYDVLGMIKSIEPEGGIEYDAILLLGASQEGFSIRLDYLANLESRKNISGPIYLLGSDRELWPIHEPIMVPLLAARTCFTEKEIYDKFVDRFTQDVGLEEVKTQPDILNKVRAEIYSEFRAIGVVIPTEADMMYSLVEKSTLKDVPHIKIESGKRPDGSRANTEDTIIKFDKFYRESHSANHIRVLVISTQPEALYQIEPVRKVLTDEKGYSKIDVAAPSSSRTENPLVINDSIARRVYSRIERLRKE